MQGRKWLHPECPLNGCRVLPAHALAAAGR
jgi:hypothetical protein